MTITQQHTDQQQDTTDQPTIAVLGTGRMGAPIAGNLLAAGFPVVVWNRTEAHATSLAEHGATVAGSPAEAVGTADVVLTMLPDGDAVAAAMLAPGNALAAMQPGAVWLQMATIGLNWIDRMYRAALDHHIDIVDAPVSGSDGPARDHQLVVLASGPDRARSRVQPIFDTIGRKTLWLGAVGNGTRMKLALNNWLSIQVEGMAETMAFAESLGLPATQLVDAIAETPLGSPFALGKARAMAAGNYQPGFALRLALKDVELARQAAHESRRELPLSEPIYQQWERAIVAGHADDDVASVIDVAREDLAGT